MIFGRALRTLATLVFGLVFGALFAGCGSRGRRRGQPNGGESPPGGEVQPF